MPELLGVDHGVHAPIFLAERAVLLCPALHGLLGDTCLGGIHLLLGFRHIYLVFARGVVIELDIALEVSRTNSRSLIEVEGNSPTKVKVVI